MPDNNKRMGKYVSMLLRHHPEEAGVILDEHGWTDVKDLIEKVNPRYPLTEEILHQLAFGPDKQRYDESYLLSGEYDIETYLDTLMATERMEELVKSITEGLENDYDKALAIEEYLRNSLKYNKKVDLRGYDNFVDAFLFEVKKGYCVHFASAMAVM